MAGAAVLAGEPLELAHVAIFWYDSVAPDRPLPIAHVERQWLHLWFAKGERTAVADAACARFSPLLEGLAPPAPSTLLQRLGWIVLYDQVPRNVFRGTARAYAYDERALPVAKALFADAAHFPELPLHAQFTVLICMVHSEVLADQDAIYAYTRERMPQALDLVASLRSITASHRERIAAFGRFPERNAALGRASTAAEAAFLESLYTASAGGK